MKEELDDRWLRDLFSEQPEADLPAFFESKLMQRISALEDGQRVATQKRKRMRLFMSGILGGTAGLGAVVFAFVFFGWYKPLVLSFGELAHKLSMVKPDFVVVAPMAAIFFLLVGDLFARKYLTKS